MADMDLKFSSPADRGLPGLKKVEKCGRRPEKVEELELKVIDLMIFFWKYDEIKSNLLTGKS